MPKILSESHSLFDKSTFSFYQENIKRELTIFTNNFKSIQYYEEKNSEKSKQ